MVRASVFLQGNLMSAPSRKPNAFEGGIDATTLNDDFVPQSGRPVSLLTLWRLGHKEPSGVLALMGKG